MTVAELIEKLKEMPQEWEVKVQVPLSPELDAVVDLTAYALTSTVMLNTPEE